MTRRRATARRAAGVRSPEFGARGGRRRAKIAPIVNLETTCFAIVALLAAAYLVVDGASIGAGVLALALRPEDRVACVDTGRRAWRPGAALLLAAGAVLAAAFPPAFAALARGSAPALAGIAVALAVRAVAAELHRRGSPDARRAWELAFAGASGVQGLLLGTVAADLLVGLPIGPAPGFVTVQAGPPVNGDSLLLGLLSCAALAVHGAAVLRRAGDPATDRLTPVALGACVALLGLLAAEASIGARVSPVLAARAAWPPFWIAPAVLLLAAGALPVVLSADARGTAVALSSATLVALVGAVALALYPGLVPSSTAVENSVTIFNGCWPPGAIGALVATAAAAVLLAGRAGLKRPIVNHAPNVG